MLEWKELKLTDGASLVQAGWGMKPFFSHIQFKLVAEIAQNKKLLQQFLQWSLESFPLQSKLYFTPRTKDCKDKQQSVLNSRQVTK